MRTILLHTDLMFSAKVKECAQQQGLATLSFKDLDSFRSAAATCEGEAAVVLDLNSTRLRPEEVIRECGKGGINLVCFYSHVDQEHAEAAAASGASLILPRSAFTKRLSQILEQLFV